MGTEEDIDKMFSDSQDEAVSSLQNDELSEAVPDRHPPLWKSLLKIGKMKNGDLRFYIETLGELKGKQRERIKYKYDIPKGEESRTLMIFLEKYYQAYSVKVSE